jgi:hypothetical protein
MSDDAQAIEYRRMMQAREAFYAHLDDLLTPPSQAPAEAVRERWEPIELLITEGPDVGETDFPESEADQRIN